MQEFAFSASPVLRRWPLSLFILFCSLQYTFMLSLEVGDPGDSLSTLLICHVRLAGCQSESVLAGGNSDGGLQVATGRRRRSSIGGEWLAATTAWALRSLPEMDQNCSFCNSAFFLCFRIGISHSAFIYLILSLCVFGSVY